MTKPPDKVAEALEALDLAVRHFDGPAKEDLGALGALAEVFEALGDHSFKGHPSSVFDLTSEPSEVLARAWARRWPAGLDARRAPLFEALLRWYTLPGDGVLDLYSGGPAAGLVASNLGRRYLGLDLRPGRVTEAISAAHAAQEASCSWAVGDAAQVGANLDARALRPSLVLAWLPDGSSGGAAHPGELGGRSPEAKRASLLLALRGAVATMAPVGYVATLAGSLVEAELVASALRPLGLELASEGVAVVPLRALRATAFRGLREFSRAHLHLLVWAKGGRGHAAARVPVEVAGASEEPYTEEDLPTWAR